MTHQGQGCSCDDAKCPSLSCCNHHVPSSKAYTPQTLLDVGLHPFTQLGWLKFAECCQASASPATVAAACSAGHMLLYALNNIAIYYNK